MPLIAITNPETTLAVDSSFYTLRSKGKRICRVPPSAVDGVMLFAGVEASRKALGRLACTGVPVTFLDMEGRVEARLVPPWKHDAASRIGQSAALLDVRTSLGIAKRLVHAKICNAIHGLRIYAGNHPKACVKENLPAIEELAARVAAAQGRESLMGIEGMAGKLYYEAFAKMLRISWTRFEGRNRRPPKDPVNSLLSYCYAVLTNMMHSYCEAVGLDPYIGYLHVNEPRRPTLALDLIEPFRALLADRLALRLLNLKTLSEKHFIDNYPNGILITREGRIELLKIFHDWSRECDEGLGRDLSSPGYLLLKEAEKFVASAMERNLQEFIPYYADSKYEKLRPS